MTPVATVARPLIEERDAELMEAGGLRAWVEERLGAGRPVAIAGALTNAAGVVCMTGPPPIFWGGPSTQDVAEVLLHAMGVPASRDWAGILETLLAGLRGAGAERMSLLPRLVEELGFRREEARTIEDPELRGAWQNEFRGGARRLGAFADALRTLLGSIPEIGAAGEAPLPAARGYSAPFVPGNPALGLALFVTSFTALTRGGPEPALAVRLPRVPGPAGDAPLRHAVSRFPGEVLFLVKDFEEVGREDRDWVRRRGRVLVRPMRLPPRPGSLFDRATTPVNLMNGWELVRDRHGAPGVDQETVQHFEQRLESEIGRLSTELAAGTYEARPLRRVYIPKATGELRGLAIPAVRDRVVQAALLGVLEPLYEPDFLDCSFGYRPNRGAHQAIAWLEGLRDEGYRWVVNADIRKCFDSIPHDILLARIAEKIHDPAVLALLERWVTLPVVEGHEMGPPATIGIPQGAPISPLLANVYLHPLDVAMTALGLPWIRYADDTLFLAPSRQEAERALEALRAFVEGELHLQLKEEKSGIASFDEGFDFLGFHFRDLEKGIMLEKRVDFRRRMLKITTAPRRDRARQLEKVRGIIAGFSAYFRTGEPLTTEQLSHLDDWGRQVVVRFLRPTPAEMARVGSLLAPVTEDLRGMTDFYPSLHRLSPQGRFTPSSVVVSPTRIVPAEEIPPPETEPQPPLALPPADESGSTDRTAGLFLNEGYAKEDLREFLRLGLSEGRPVLSDDGALFVGVHGCTLTKASMQLVVRKSGAEVFHAALRDLKQVVVQAVGVLISTMLLHELAKRGIQVHFLDWRGILFADLRAPSKESPAILRGQLRAYESETGVAIAKEMLAAKGRNQLQLIRLYARYRERTDPALARTLGAAIATMERNVAFFEAIEGPTIEAVRGRLLAIEGRIAAAHFRAIAALIGPKRGFVARTRDREGFDPGNSALDYLYRLLYTRCHRALVAAGLDPRLGFVHTDGPDGKLSLLYDFIEEFRALGADRPALALLTRGSKITKTKGDRLSMPTRRRLLAAFVRNLAASCRYRGSRRPLSEIIEAQARHLAEVLVKPKTRTYRGFRYNH